MQQEPMRKVPSTVTPYGRACANCSRSKCRCIRLADSGSCERSVHVICVPTAVWCELTEYRCRRLNRECRPSDPVRKPRRPAVSKTTQLERRLDGLVSLFKSAQQSNAAAPVLGIESLSGVYSGAEDQSPNHGSSVTPSSSRIPMPQRAMSTEVFGHSGLMTPSLSISSAASIADISPEDWITGIMFPVEITTYEAEDNLRVFRNLKSNYFPFLYIAPTTTAQQLRQERPFLWLCIMSTSCRSVKQQCELVHRIKASVGPRLLLHSERNMDLLLGLLVFTTW